MHGRHLIVQAALAGKGVKAIGATMQESPIQLMTLPESGIRSLFDVPGHRIAMHRDGIALLNIVLVLHGIDARTVDGTVSGWTLNQLVDGTYAAVQGYATSEPHILARCGHAVRLIPIRHRSLCPWAQMMFTTDAVINGHGDVLGRFVAACKTSWQQAMTDLDETACLIAACSNVHDDAGECRHILDTMVSLISGNRGLDHCVVSDPDRWRRNLATYARFGMIERQPAFDEIVCDRFM